MWLIVAHKTSLPQGIVLQKGIIFDVNETFKAIAIKMYGKLISTFAFLYETLIDMRLILPRYLFITIALLSFALDSYGQGETLFEVDGYPVTQDEFEYIYKKNNSKDADYTKRSLEEYYELYKKFKLKVRKARDLGLDTLPRLKKELQGYRDQLSKSYLVDKEISNNLLQEAFKRQQHDIRMSHILVTLSPKAKEGEVAAAMMKAKDIKKEIDNGKSFEDAASEYSADKSSAINGGDIGYYTAMLPEGFYELENALYTTSVGSISDIVRSKVGLHIIKVTDKRDAWGQVEAAHLLIRKKVAGKEKTNAKYLADSLYQELQNGENFAELVRKYSDDNTTKTKDGSLGYFGINKYDKAFEKVAFTLENDGDFAAPIETKVGWHIIKRLSKRDISNFDDAKKRLTAKLTKAKRYDIAKEALIENIKVNGNYQLDEKAFSAFVKNLDQSFYTYQWKPYQFEDVNLFTFDNGISSSLREFANYLKKNSRKRLRYDKTTPVANAAKEMLNEYVQDYAIQYEESTLESKYPEFKALMREYSEGILLFEVTKMNIWDKASSDTVGLERFFENNKYKYEWKERAVLETFTVYTDDINKIKEIRKAIKKKSWEEVQTKYNGPEGNLVEMKTGTHEYGAKILSGLKWKKGTITEPEFDKKKSRASFKYIRDILPVSPKTLDESRGYVLADYQDFLELLWIKELEESYEVKRNDKLFYSLIK